MFKNIKIFINQKKFFKIVRSVKYLIFYLKILFFKPFINLILFYLLKPNFVPLKNWLSKNSLGNRC